MKRHVDMKSLRSAPPRPLLVTWRDSAQKGGWYSRKILDEVHLAPRVWSIGWLVRETSDEITLTRIMTEDSDTMADLFTIPKGCIIKREIVK